MTKKFEILIQDVGTEKFVYANTENQALKQAKLMVDAGSISNHFGSNGGCVTVDEYSVENLERWWRQAEEQKDTLLKERDEKHQKLIVEVQNKIAEMKMLEEDLKDKGEMIRKISIERDETERRLTKANDAIEELEKNNAELEEENQRYYEVEKAVKTIKEFVGGI